MNTGRSGATAPEGRARTPHRRPGVSASPEREKAESGGESEAEVREVLSPTLPPRARPPPTRGGRATPKGSLNLRAGTR